MAAGRACHIRTWGKGRLWVETQHPGLLLLIGRGRLRNSDLDQCLSISLKHMPIVAKHIGGPLMLF